MTLMKTKTANTTQQIKLMHQKSTNHYIWFYGQKPVAKMARIAQFNCPLRLTRTLFPYLLLGAYEMYESEIWDEFQLEQFIEDATKQTGIPDISKESLRELWVYSKELVQ